MDREFFTAAMEASRISTPIKATRRIFFSHLSQSIEERGHFHVDYMFGSGTGIVIRVDSLFFLLTENHVIENATKYEFNNESPFWVSAYANRSPQEMLDYLMPANILHIGELISGRGVRVDTADLVLVELFYPAPGRLPDRFIDFDEGPGVILSKDQYFEGQFLQCAGYPFSRNDFEHHEEDSQGNTHTTRIQRHVELGICKFDDGFPYMSCEHVSDEFPDLNGASGGVITNVEQAGVPVKMAGMLVSSNPKKARFIPAYLIMEAISLRNKARVTPLDPAWRGPPDKEFIEWINSF
ncbi:hypothetical protein [Ralstonia pseudosolanacearum]